MIRRHSRIPGLLALDLRSQLAGIHAASTRVLESWSRATAPPTVKAVMRKMIDDTTAAVSQRLQRLPDGTWHDVTYLGAATTGDRQAHRVAMTMTQDRRPAGVHQRRHRPAIRLRQSSHGALARRDRMLDDRAARLGPSLLHRRRAEAPEFNAVPGTINCIDRNGAVSNLQAIMHRLSGAPRCVSKMISCDAELQKEPDRPGSASTWTRMSGIDQWGHPYATVSLDEIASGSGAFSFRDGIDQGGNFIIPRSEAGDCEVWEQAARSSICSGASSRASATASIAAAAASCSAGWATAPTSRRQRGIRAFQLADPERTVGRPFGTERTLLFALRHRESAQTSSAAVARLDGGTGRALSACVVPPKSVGVRLLGDDVWVMDIGVGGRLWRSDQARSRTGAQRRRRGRGFGRGSRQRFMAWC